VDNNISFVYIDKNPEMKLINYTDIATLEDTFVEELTGQKQAA
jgi:hypothetical protein